MLAAAAGTWRRAPWTWAGRISVAASRAAASHAAWARRLRVLGLPSAGLGEQVDGGGLEDVAIQSGAADLPVEVGGDRGRGEGGSTAVALMREKRARWTERRRLPSRYSSPSEHEGEGAALAAAETQEHADFLQGGSRVVLGVVEDEHEGERVDVGEVFFEHEEVGAALEAGALAELGEQDFEHAGGRERGLGDEQRAGDVWVRGIASRF